MGRSNRQSTGGLGLTRLRDGDGSLAEGLQPPPKPGVAGGLAPARVELRKLDRAVVADKNEEILCPCDSRIQERGVQHDAMCGMVQQQRIRKFGPLAAMHGDGPRQAQFGQLNSSKGNLPVVKPDDDLLSLVVD